MIQSERYACLCKVGWWKKAFLHIVGIALIPTERRPSTIAHRQGIKKVENDLGVVHFYEVGKVLHTTYAAAPPPILISLPRKVPGLSHQDTQPPLPALLCFATAACQPGLYDYFYIYCPRLLLLSHLSFSLEVLEPRFLTTYYKNFPTEPEL